MSSKITHLVTFALASMIATPAAAAAAASPGLYLCMNRDFDQNPVNLCYHYNVSWGQCTSITDRFPPGERAVSSAGPDEGNWCTLNEGWTGAELQLYWPGFAELDQRGWNDRAKSFNCAAL